MLPYVGVAAMVFALWAATTRMCAYTAAVGGRSILGTVSSATSSLQSSGTGLATRSFTYNALGNMTYKSDAGTYNYPAAGVARPHAVSSVTGTVNGFANPSFATTPTATC